MLILFNGNSLVRKLNNGDVPELHKFIYLVVPALFIYLIDLTSSDSVHPFPIGLRASIYLIGTTGLYLINRRGDNSSFIERYICLNFPVFLIVELFTFTWTITTPLFLSPENHFGVGRLIMYTISNVLYFSLMGYWIFRASKKG